jgi:hypothetical protein
MKAIDKLILHVVHNLFPLNEYKEGAMKQILQQYREEADDLNINISDEQLKKYIERFDRIKQSIIAKGGTDLVKLGAGGKLEVILPLAKLIKLVTASPGIDDDDEEDKTPDVVYQDNGVTIWNGAKENNCITYGRGEKWCITRGSWSNYRYGPRSVTFYLVKNSNIADSDPTSFVVIHVQENGQYGISLRTNNGDRTNLSWDQMIAFAPWLKDVPNLKQIVKYIPLSNTEKLNQKYRNETISIREWDKFPYSIKQQYIVVRTAKNWFSDITNEEFVEKYLPKYPQLANFIAITPGLILPQVLLKNLDKFSNQDRKSIISNLRDKISLNFLSSSYLPFEVKKLLATLNKWKLKTNQRIYTTDDGSTIVLLTIDDDIKMGLYQEEDDFPNVKVNKRTSKYISQYKELDKIPFKNIIKLVTDDVLEKDTLNKILDYARTNNDSAIIIKKTEDGEILLDSNSLTAYKIKDGKVTKLLFNDEDVQKLLVSQKENVNFQENIIKLVVDSITNQDNIPPTMDKEGLSSIIKSTPYDKRNTPNGVIIVPDGGEEGGQHILFVKGNKNNWDNAKGFDVDGRYSYRNEMDKADWKGYFNYLRATNQIYSDTELIDMLRNFGRRAETKKAFISANPPLDAAGLYAVAISDNTSYVINKQSPKDSFKISPLSGKLLKASIAPNLARQLLGQAVVAAQPGIPAAGAGRRGRPAGVPNAPRAAAPAAAVPAGGLFVNIIERMTETGLLTAFNSLPRRDRTYLSGAGQAGTGIPAAWRSDPAGDRGAARRNNQLGTAGSVGQVITVGSSKIYIIRLINQQIIASINMQPGNRNYVLLPNGTALTLNSPAELVPVLRQRNLVAEVRNYIVREYLAQNPHHLDEVRNMIQQHIRETKKS